jgi:signal recognition particle receptor subunit alpha
VASEIATRLCDSVAGKLEGRVLGTFAGVTSTVRDTVRESLVHILSPKRRVDILRDVMEARSQRRPYVCAFLAVKVPAGM